MTKVFIWIFCLSIQIVNAQFPSFKELLGMQKSNQNEFDVMVLKKGFKFSYSKDDAVWRTKRYIYTLEKFDTTRNLMRIEKAVDTVQLGKLKNNILIVTLDIITFDKQYYTQLLIECKNDGYNFWGSNNYDREYPNMKTEAYHKASSVAKFSTGELNGNKKFYKIAVSFSPK